MLLQAVLGHEQLDLSTLIDQAFSQNSHVRVERDREAYRLTVHLAEGRSQVVFVRESDHVASERLLEIESICSPALTHYMEAALRLNGEIAHGGLAIRDYDGKPMFVAIDNYPRSTVDPEEIRRSVLEAARRADAIEHILTGQDVH